MGWSEDRVPQNIMLNHPISCVRLQTRWCKLVDLMLSPKKKRGVSTHTHISCNYDYIQSSIKIYIYIYIYPLYPGHTCFTFIWFFKIPNKYVICPATCPIPFHSSFHLSTLGTIRDDCWRHPRPAGAPKSMLSCSWLSLAETWLIHSQTMMEKQSPNRWKSKSPSMCWALWLMKQIVYPVYPEGAKQLYQSVSICPNGEPRSYQMLPGSFSTYQSIAFQITEELGSTHWTVGVVNVDVDGWHVPEDARPGKRLRFCELEDDQSK